jgi:hypothetical protein
LLLCLENQKALFFSEEKNQKTFIVRRWFEDTGFGRIDAAKQQSTGLLGGLS